MATNVIMTDGTTDFSAGVNSVKTTTIQSQLNPNGLARNELGWLINASVRDGGISQRWGWQPLQVLLPYNAPQLAGTGGYQGGFMYEPDFANPYLIFAVGGDIFKWDPATNAVTNLSQQFNLRHPKTEPIFYFCQAEKWLVIQAGDLNKGGPVNKPVTDNMGNTLPLFWDGSTLRRSHGITTNSPPAPPNNGINEIPPATTMDYYMGRLWYAQGRTVSAGDIVGGPSGTAANTQRDAVLNVTENPLVLGGDGFTVPSNDGNVRAVRHSANINAALGQGQLFIFTRRAIYALSVPVSRADWIASGNSGTDTSKGQMPLLTVVQLVNGACSDRSIVAVNGDLFYQSLEPGIRSLVAAIRYFQQWGNIDISSNEERLLQLNDRSLLIYSSGIEWDNRLLMTALPIQKPQGVVHQAIAPLDFVPMSFFGAQLNPIWEGVYDGLDHFQLFRGDFGGLQRAFSVMLSRSDQSIQVWELTQANYFENGENRVIWQIETPAFNFGTDFKLKKLQGGEIWVDRIHGTVDFIIEYRPDGQTCWVPWHRWQVCSAKDCREDTPACLDYPIAPVPYGPGYRNSMVLPFPAEMCDRQMNRITTVAHQFQARLTIKGYCRVRAIYLHATEFARQMYEKLTC
jgi:hypothetical protein